MSTICRICGKRNKFGQYCAACVPKARIREKANRLTDDANLILVDWRLKRGLSKLEAAKLLGTSPESLNMAEWKNPNLSAGMRRKIADATGIPIDDLFGGIPLPKIGRPRKSAESSQPIVTLRAGENQREIARVAREAREKGYRSYGQYEAAKYMERMEKR